MNNTPNANLIDTRTRFLVDKLPMLIAEGRQANHITKAMEMLMVVARDGVLAVSKVKPHQIDQALSESGYTRMGPGVTRFRRFETDIYMRMIIGRYTDEDDEATRIIGMSVVLVTVDEDTENEAIIAGARYYVEDNSKKRVGQVDTLLKDFSDFLPSATVRDYFDMIESVRPNWMKMALGGTKSVLI